MPPMAQQGGDDTFLDNSYRKFDADLTGDEAEEELQEKRDGYNALTHLIWDLRLDRGHLVAHAVVKRIRIDCKNVETIPLKWLT